MKSIAIAFMLLLGVHIASAQSYPIQSSEELQTLAVSPDLAKIKLLIFDDTHVYADRFLYFALLYGMVQDNVPIAIAQSVASESQGPNFISKCEICDASRAAFSAYAKYAQPEGKKNPYPDLVSKNAEKRHDAIKMLTDKYTSAFLALLQLSDVEQQRLGDKLSTMRKSGMNGLNKNQFGSSFCPSCDGATHK